MKRDPLPAPDLAVTITLFEGLHDTGAGNRVDVPWRELVECIEVPSVRPSKKSMELIKLARFGDQPNGNGSLRHGGNIDAVFGVEGDYDAGSVPITEARKRIEDAGIRAVLYSTASSEPAYPRWRVFAPLSKPYPPADRERFVRRLDVVLGCILAKESFTLGQTFYIGAVDGRDYQCEVTFSDPMAGRCIDLIEGISATARPSDAKPARLKLVRKYLVDLGEFERRRDEIAEAMQYIDSDPHDDWIKVGCALYHASGGGDEAWALWDEWSQGSPKYPGPDETKKKWASFKSDRQDVVGLGTVFAMARAAGWAGGCVGRRVIQFTADAPHLAVRECDEVLAGVGVFQQQNRLVQVLPVGPVATDDQTDELETGEVMEVGGVRRAAVSWSIRALPAATLAEKLSAVVVFERLTAAGKPRTADAPDKVVRMLLERGEWTHVPPLSGVIYAPAIREDGTIIDALGYDLATGLLRVGDTFPPIVERPSKADAQEASRVLLEPFDQVPFASDQDKAAFVALVLTLLDRHNMDTAPAFFLTAPTARSGKTLLADCAALIASGGALAKSSWPEKDEAELKKGITASLIAGDAAILFDNVATGAPVYAPPLCNYLTSGQWSDRILGESKNWSGPARMTIMLTGNNITPSKDMVGRSIEIRIEPRAERSEQQSFRHGDLRAHVREHRQQLLPAALTILRAWSIAREGDPMLVGQARVVGGFEQWRARVSACVVWLGMPDPALTQDRHHGADIDDESEAMLLVGLYSIFAKDQFTVRDVIDTANAPSYAQGSGKRRSVAPECQANLRRVIGDAIGEITSQRLGIVFRRMRDRRVQGLAIRSTGKARGGVQRWRVEKLL